MRKQLVLILFTVYCVFLLWLIIISYIPRPTERAFKWQLLWSYRSWIVGDLYGKTERVQNINNILVFIPFGLFFLVKRWK